MKANARANSLDQSVGDDGDSKVTLGDMTSNNTFKDPDSSLNNADLERELEDNVKRILGKRDGEIVCACYGINGRPEKINGKLQKKWYDRNTCKSDFIVSY